MNIKLELLADVISEAINFSISNLEIDTNQINSQAVMVLDEIKEIIQNIDIENDFDVVEEIVCIFEKHNIDAGGRHDF